MYLKICVFSYISGTFYEKKNGLGLFLCIVATVCVEVPLVPSISILFMYLLPAKYKLTRCHLKRDQKCNHKAAYVTVHCCNKYPTSIKPVHISKQLNTTVIFNPQYCLY